MSETSAEPSRKRQVEDVSSTSAKESKKKDKKWWELKREKKKAKRALGATLNDGNADEKDSTNIDASKKNSANDQDALESQASASLDASTSSNRENKKKKKSKNKAMSAHATYGVDNKEAPHADSDLVDDGDDSGKEVVVASTSSPSALEDYAESHSEGEPPVLSALRTATKQAMPNANHMISGPLQGRLLKSLVAIKGAKRVLEIGTFTGYSAQCMAEALKEGGSTGGSKIVTLEIDPEAAAIAKEYFTKGGHDDTIEMLVGPAMDALVAMKKHKSQEAFDLVFMDADKRAYRKYYDFLLGSHLLAPGALILCDNVLFKGMVLNSTPAGKAKLLQGKKLNYWQRRHQDIADALHDFNAYVARDPRTSAVLVPLRDGLTVIRKL